MMRLESVPLLVLLFEMRFSEDQPEWLFWVVIADSQVASQ